MFFKKNIYIYIIVIFTWMSVHTSSYFFWKLIIELYSTIYFKTWGCNLFS